MYGMDLPQINQLIQTIANVILVFKARLIETETSINLVT